MVPSGLGTKQGLTVSTSLCVSEHLNESSSRRVVVSRPQPPILLISPPFPTPGLSPIVSTEGAWPPSPSERRSSHPEEWLLHLGSIAQCSQLHCCPRRTRQRELVRSPRNPPRTLARVLLPLGPEVQHSPPTSPTSGYVF